LDDEFDPNNGDAELYNDHYMMCIDAEYKSCKDWCALKGPGYLWEAIFDGEYDYTDW
jgi:hypothetical protein